MPGAGARTGFAAGSWSPSTTPSISARFMPQTTSWCSLTRGYGEKGVDVRPGQHVTSIISGATAATPLGMTQRRLADHLGYDVKVVNPIVNGRTSVTAEMALKLGAAFRTTPKFWLNAQKAVDLHRAARRLASLPTPLRVDQFCPELSR